MKVIGTTNFHTELDVLSSKVRKEMIRCMDTFYMY